MWSQSMAFNNVNTPVTRSTTAPWVLRKQLQDCLFLPHVIPTSASVTYRMASSSAQTCRRFWSSILSLTHWCGSSGGWEHKGARCCPRPASDVSQTCLHGCSVVQLACTGNPSHQTSDKRVSTDVSMQPDPVQDQLLQRFASQCTDCHEFRTIHLWVCSRHRWAPCQAITAPSKFAECACSWTYFHLPSVYENRLLGVLSGFQNHLSGSCLGCQDSGSLCHRQFPSHSKMWFWRIRNYVDMYS